MKRTLFGGISRQGWWNLSFLAAAVVLAVYAALSISARGLFEYWGIDYRTFRASAQIAQTHGYAAVYDLTLQEAAQMPLVERYASPRVLPDATVVPTPYLPVFILPFHLILPFDPVTGWLVWTALMAGLLALYFLRLRRVFAPSVGPPTAALFVALPTALTLAFGQVNVLLLIGLSEFVLALRRQRELQAGMWLGLLMVKPHMLVLLVLGILLQKRWKAVAGAGGIGALVLAASLGLAGVAGLTSWLHLLVGYAGALPSTYPDSMMNWRALMIGLQPLLGLQAAAWIAGVGMIATAAAGLAAWLLPRPEEGLPDAATAVYASTSAVAWHAHIHLALPLLGTLHGSRDPRYGTSDWLNATILFPTLGFSILGILEGPTEAHRFAGLAFFAINLGLLVSLGLRRRPPAAGSQGL